ncbi:MAG: choice-of-anchor Q domain-containing protein, partial [Verrucomicrobiota bacterium]
MVTTTEDTINSADGVLSLREAVIAANENAGSDTIYLSNQVCGLSIPGHFEDDSMTGDLDLRDTVGTTLIIGLGPDMSEIDAAGIDRVLQVFGSVSVVISNVIISGGLSPAGHDGDETVAFGGTGRKGGGILNWGSLALNRCEVRGNQTGRGGDGSTSDGVFGSFGGKGGPGGGIFHNGSMLILHRCVIAYNRAGSGGRGGYHFSDNWGVDAGDGGDGGGLWSIRPVVVEETLFVGNRAGNGGGIFAWPADGGNGGHGGAIWNQSSLSLLTCTFSDCTPGRGSSEGTPPGVDGSGGGIHNFGSASIVHSTFADSSIHKAGGTVTLGSSLLAGRGAICSGSMVSSGYNVIEDSTDCTVSGDLTGVLLDVPAGLAPLADNGGPTRTHGLLFFSAALNSGDPAFTGPPLTDQRGAPRVVDGRLDIGAFEGLLNGSSAELVLSKSGPVLVETNALIHYALSVENAGFSDGIGVVVTDTLPASVSFVSASPACEYSNHQVVCSVPLLAAGAETQFMVTVRAPMTPVEAMTNLAWVGA